VRCAVEDSRPTKPVVDVNEIKGARGSMSRRTKAIVDRLSVWAFTGCWIGALVVLLPDLLSGDHLRTTGLAVIPCLLAGYLVADFLAGSVHWLADRYFDPETPVLGPMLIAPFREHHVDSASIGRHDFFEVSGNNALVCIPVVLALFALPPLADSVSISFALFGLSVTAALVATNQFHGWAHAEAPPAFARWLHQLGLILTPERHALHHRADHDRAYCVTSGWLNPLLDRFHVFERIEKWIAGVSTAGRRPHA
jgi:hypothetical protein